MLEQHFAQDDNPGKWNYLPEKIHCIRTTQVLVDYFIGAYQASRTGRPSSKIGQVSR